MKKLKKEAILLMFNLTTLLLLTVAVLDTQRNRNLYIEESNKNALLTMELNNKNNTIKDLENKLKNFKERDTH